jgi:hypothetical protein
MFIDAAATIPYTGQNITTIYTKDTTGYTGTFTVSASSGTGPLACVNVTNAFVSFVDVNIATTTATPAIVCKGSTVTLAAEADGKRKVAIARADSAETIINASAKARAMELTQHKLTPLFVEYKKIEKWDGQLPTTMAGGSGTFLNIK